VGLVPPQLFLHDAPEVLLARFEILVVYIGIIRLVATVRAFLLRVGRRRATVRVVHGANM
jgi:hypothetical protein